MPQQTAIWIPRICLLQRLLRAVLEEIFSGYQLSAMSDSLANRMRTASHGKNVIQSMFRHFPTAWKYLSDMLSRDHADTVQKNAQASPKRPTYAAWSASNVEEQSEAEDDPSAKLYNVEEVTPMLESLFKDVDEIIAETDKKNLAKTRELESLRRERDEKAKLVAEKHKENLAKTRELTSLRRERDQKVKGLVKQMAEAGLHFTHIRETIERLLTPSDDMWPQSNLEAQFPAGTTQVKTSVDEKSKKRPENAKRKEKKKAYHKRLKEKKRTGNWPKREWPWETFDITTPASV